MTTLPTTLQKKFTINIMQPASLLVLLISLTALDFITEFILDYLNLKYQKSELPDELKGIYNEEEYKKSQDYLKANSKFGFISSTLNFIVVVAVLSTGTLGHLEEALRGSADNSILEGLFFFGILFIASDIFNLPFSIYNTFVIEEKFGFNKTTVKTFIVDKLKSYLLTAIVGGLILGFLLWLIIRLDHNFWIYFWIFISLFLLVVNMFYTSLIVPLFNKLVPLGEGELRESIENYSKKNKFSLTNIFVIDGSKRSSKANAFFSGIGPRKKIVLYDTLINNHSKEELVAVLAHEVGHYKKKHVITGLIVSIVQVGLMLFILSLLVFNPNISYALGDDQLSIPLNLVAFGILYSPISHITGLIMNVISRKHEYEADAFAAKTSASIELQNALKKLSVDNLSNLTPHPAYVFMHYSHPPLLERLRELKKYK